MDVGFAIDIYSKVSCLQSKPHTVLYIQYISEFFISHSHGSLYLCMYVWYTCVSLSNSQMPSLFVNKHFHAYKEGIYLCSHHFLQSYVVLQCQEVYRTMNNWYQFVHVGFNHLHQFPPFLDTFPVESAMLISKYSHLALPYPIHKLLCLAVTSLLHTTPKRCS